MVNHHPIKYSCMLCELKHKEYFVSDSMLMYHLKYCISSTVGTLQHFDQKMRDGHKQRIGGCRAAGRSFFGRRPAREKAVLNPTNVEMKQIR